MFDRPVLEIHCLSEADSTPGTVQRYWLHIADNGIGEPIRVPIIVARGAQPGPVLGITAAVHGNELNGISVVQRLFGELDSAALRGTVIGVLAMNVPGVLLRQRQFNDGEDLNRVAPGKADGSDSQIYAHRLIERIIAHFDLMIDLHTASNGRVNSLYVRADMDNPGTARMARLQSPQIIVHNPPNDKTMRGAAASRGVDAITVELRDPNRFQPGTVEDGLQGVRNVLYDRGMLDGTILCPVTETILCTGSYWLYTDQGGLLEVVPRVAQRVAKGELIARVRTIFGEVVKEVFAPEDSIVVGRSVDPINQTGSRIVHLGQAPTGIPCVVDPPA